MVNKEDENAIIKELQKVLIEQDSKDILFIKENEKFDYTDLMISFKNTQEITLNKFLENTPNKLYDVIVLDNVPSFYEKEDIITLINILLSYISHSLIIITDMYTNKLGNNTDMLSGIRKLYPILLTDFDFSYKILDYNSEKYQIYNFFPNKNYDELKQDNIFGNNHADKSTMNIAYVLPHLNLTGGLKYILSHAKFLKHRGHNVYLMYEGNARNNIIPSWSNITEQDICGQIIIPQDADYTPFLDKFSIDVMVAGYFTQLSKLSNYDVPVLYWEQGSESLFGEFKELLSCNSIIRKSIQKTYRLNVYIASVSPIVSKILETKYSRKSQILYTGIDTKFYHPCEKPWRTWPQILLVGTPLLRFKGFDLAINVLEQLWNDGYKFQVIWAMQHKSINCKVSFPLEMACQVSQEKLAELYRNADLFISTSHFESFPMPPMEAFASGTAVVAVNNGGIELYAKPGQNILLAEQGNVYDLYSAIQYLLEKPDLRRILANNARNDSLQYSIEIAIDQLEEILFNIIIDNKKINMEPQQI